MTTELFDPSARSNFPHAHAFVVQAWDSSLDRWVDTRHGNINLPACLRYTVPAVLLPERWVNGKPGKIRVVHRLSEACL